MDRNESYKHNGEVTCDSFNIVCFAGGQQGNVLPFSDEDSSIETLSHCSSLSERTSAPEDGML